MAKADFSISQKEMVCLAVEHWRLSREVQSASAGARHALRKIGELLQTHGIRAESLDGLPYDPGLSATVIERVPSGDEDRIIETISPLITLQGKVIQSAEIIVSCK